MKKLYLILFVLLAPSISYGCTCFFRPLKEKIDLDKGAKNIYLKAKILGNNTSISGLPYGIIPYNVQVLEYWHKEEVELNSDTLTIFDDITCTASELHKDSIHLIISNLDQGIYRTYGCEGNWLFSTYKDEVHQLAKVHPVWIPKTNKPAKMSEPPAINSLALSEVILFLSLLLNAVLLYVLIKRKKFST